MTTTQHTTRHVTIPVRVNMNELMQNVMGSAWETWSWWTRILYANGCGWDRIPASVNDPYVLVAIIDPNDEDEEDEITVTLSVGDILTAVGDVLTLHPWVRWDNMDACDSDLVMQTAVLGTVVYG